MSEVVITPIITSVSTLGGVFLGYYISSKIELDRRAKECYFKYIIPLQNSSEDLDIAMKSWAIIAKKYLHVPEDTLDEKQKREIETAKKDVDEQGLKFTKVLETFQLSEARQVLRSIRPNIELETLIIPITHVMVTLIKYPNLQAPRETVLAPPKFPLHLVEQIKELKSKLNEITLNDFIKAYKRIFG